MTEAVLTGTSGDVQAAVDAGINLAEPFQLDTDGRFFAVTTPAGGAVHLVDLEEERDKHRDAPKRKTGKYTVHDAESFLGYFTKHGTDASEVWADVVSRQIIGVLDAHPHEGWPGWGEHRVKLQLHHTPAWTAWTGMDGKRFSQVGFAEHIEAHRLDVTDPDAATLTEISRTFKATKTVIFDESHYLSTGQVQLQWHEDVEARAGKKGDVEIPEQFQLGLQPFEGSAQYLVTARLRFDISSGSLSLTYLLDRPEETLRTAFADVLTSIQEGVHAPVFNGISA